MNLILQVYIVNYKIVFFAVQADRALQIYSGKDRKCQFPGLWLVIRYWSYAHFGYCNWPFYHICAQDMQQNFANNVRDYGEHLNNRKTHSGMKIKISKNILVTHQWTAVMNIVNIKYLLMPTPFSHLTSYIPT